MPNNHTTLVSLFGDIANSIRNKTGGSTNIVADNFPNVINNIHNDATITSNGQLLNGITAYGPNGKFTGNISTVAHPNPTISTATFNTSSLNVEVQATHLQNSGIVVGGTTTATTNVPIASGTVTSSVTSHTVTTPTITVSHSGNITTIGTTTKPSGTAGTNYYQIGFSNSVTNGNTNTRSYGNISVNGYVTTANNTASAWSNKAISATVTQPATYYINKGNLTESNISGTSYLETTGDYGFRATVVVPEGYHAGETVVKNFTTGIFPAPESKGTANRMLTGYSLYDEDGKLITGSMPNQGAQNATLSTQGGTYIIPEGYHNGNGIVTASLGAASINAPSGSVAQSTPSFTWDATNRKLTASVAAKSGTAYANVTGAGYIGTGTKSGTFNLTASSNSYTLDAASINTPTATIQQSKPGLAFNATTGIVTASVAQKTGTVYANTANAGYAPVATRSGTVTLSAAESNTINVGLGSVSDYSAKYKAQSKPTFSINTSTGVVTASVAATTQDIYRNVSVGYVPNNTTKLTFTMNASSNTYTLDAATANTQTGAATVTGGNASVTLSNITTQSTATNYKIVYSATGGSVSAKTVTATAGPGYVKSGTVSATATVNAATGATNSGTVYLKAATPTNGSASGAATISASGANASTSITGMETTTTNTGFIVSASANATSGAITALTKTATASVTDGYSNTGASATATATVSAVAAKTASNSNTQYIKAATVSDYSAKYKAQSKPTFSINKNTGVVTASVAATTQDVYRNVSTGYVGTANTTKLTFTMNASSNTYNAISALGTTTRTPYVAQFLSEGLVTNASDNTVNTDDTIILGTKTNGYYRINANAAAQTGAGYITSGTTYQKNDALYIKKQTVTLNNAAVNLQNIISVTPYTNGTSQSVIFSDGYTHGGSVEVLGVASGTLAAGSAAVLNNSNGNVRYYRNVSTAGYIAANTTAYYLQLNTKAGSTTTVTSTSETTLVNAGQFVTGAIKVKGGAGSFKSPIDGNGSITAGLIDTATRTTVDNVNIYTLQSTQDGTVTTLASILPINSKGIFLTTDTMSSTLNNTVAAIDVGETAITTTVSGTISRAPVLRYGGIPSGTVNAAGGAIATTAPTSGPYITVNTPANTATATATVSAVTAGFTDGTNYGKTQGTKSGGAAAMANRYIPIKVGDVTYPAIDWTPGLTYSVNYNNGYIAMSTGTKSNSVAPTSSNAGWIASMPNISFVGSQSSNSLQLVTKTGAGSNHQNNLYIAPYTNGTAQTVMNRGEMLVANHLIVNGVAAGTLAAGSAAVLNNSNGNIRYYRNVSAAGYLATNTTAYYLQLNTKAGGTTTVSAETTLVNAGQFVIGAIKAKPAAATYTIANFDLSCPLLTTA